MEPSNLVKVIAAFVAGVVVALGSALIYVRVSDMVHPRPVAQTLLPPQPPPMTDTALPVAASDTQPAEPPVKEPEPAPDPDHGTPAVEPVRKVNTAKRKPPVRTRSEPDPSQIDTSKYEPSHDAVDVAQNYPPANLPATAPPPVVNDPPSTAAAAQMPALQQIVQTPINPVRQPNVVTLQAGTNIGIRLGETLSTDHNYTGDTFRGTLESPVIMNGFIIADRGSKVLGKIVDAEKAGRMQGVAGLTLALTEINTTDGQRVKIETNSVITKGPSNSGEDAAKIAGGAALGAIIGAVAGGGKGAAIGAGAGGAAGTGAVLLTHGRPAVLPTEARLNFRLANPVTITEKLNY